VHDATGREVAKPSAFGSSVALVPGSYTADLGDGKETPFTLAEGQKVVLQAKKP
jgi:hypothetical protein